MLISSIRAKVFFLVACTLLCATHVQGRQIVDMIGRKVSVPDVIRRVYGSSPPATDMIYAIDPGLIVGLNTPIQPNAARFLVPAMGRLPVLGGWFGQGRKPNLEALLDVRPDVMVVWVWEDLAMNETIERTARMLNIPVVNIKMDRLSDYPRAFLFLGKLFHREKRGRELSDYARRVVARVKLMASSIPDDKKVSVYFAEGPDGLCTECDESMHTELINLAGGKNIYHCRPKSTYGMERISIEQVMASNPEVILAMDRRFVRDVYKDPQWRTIRAVRNKRVYLIPSVPFNWFSRPPSFMRLLGVSWVAHALYPKRFAFDASGETEKFYSLFLGIHLNERTLREVLGK